MEPECGKKTYTCSGGTPHYFLDGGTIGVGKKHILGWGGHHTYFIDGANNWVGAPHNIERSRYPSKSSFLAILTSTFGVGKKHILGGGDTAHILLMEQTKGGDTAQH